jgi:YD repeat-containing protein
MSRERNSAAYLVLVLLVGSCSCGRHAADTEEYRFDAEGRLQTIITPDGNRINCSRNSSGSLEEVRYRGGRVRYGYDPAGQLAWLQDDGGLTAFSRDALGRVRDAIWARELHRLIHYDYDLWNHVTGIEVYNLDAVLSSRRAPEATRQISQKPPASENKWREWRASVLESSAWLRRNPEFAEYGVSYRYDAQGRMVSLDGPGGVIVLPPSRAGATRP